MTDPTTPTGKRLADDDWNRADIYSDIFAIEAEAATAERKRWLSIANEREQDASHALAYDNGVEDGAAAERERLLAEGIRMVSAIDAEMRRRGKTESADAFPPIMADFLRELMSDD